MCPAGGGGHGGQAVPHLRGVDRPRRGHRLLLLLLRTETLLQTPKSADGGVGGDAKERVSGSQGSLLLMLKATFMQPFLSFRPSNTTFTKI